MTDRVYYRKEEREIGSQDEIERSKLNRMSNIHKKERGLILHKTYKTNDDIGFSDLVMDRIISTSCVKTIYLITQVKRKESSGLVLIKF